MRYTKKPVTIEAVEFTNATLETLDKISEFMNQHQEILFDDNTAEPKIKIETLEGPMYASIGDYIIKGIKGEFYACKPDIFKLTYDSDAVITTKSLHNTTANGARKNVKDIQFWGDGDMFKLISKASSENEGWMKSTKAMQVGHSVVVQVTTQQRNPDGSYSIAEALTTVPNAEIVNIMEGDKVVSRQIQYKLFNI